MAETAIPTSTLRSLMRNTVDVLPEGALEQRLARANETGRALRVKLGLDPTAPAVTLGWAVQLEKLRAFQEAGHQPVLIIGDYTSRVGDPSGRSKTRPMLTPEEIEANVQATLAEYGRVIDVDRVELRRNSEWLEPLGTAGILELAARSTVARMLERDDFAKRFAERAQISLQELLYPLLQGYDSVAVRADVELGGTDQKFNLLVGRDLQPAWGQEPQIIMTSPLLVGTDGVQKMSQSLGNYIGVAEDPSEMYAKTMRIPDAAVPEWLRLASGLPEDEAEAVAAGLADGSIAPVDGKRRLARAVVARFHDAAAGPAAEQEFLRVHRDHELPEEMPSAPLPSADPAHLPALMVEHLGVGSTSEARRLIQSGGVRLAGDVVTDLDVARSALEGQVLQVGRRRFVRFAA
jgi:tyrosyl-tRNA synthetase